MPIQTDIDTTIVKLTSNPNVEWYTSRVLASFFLVTIYPLEAYKKWAQRGYPKGDFHPYKGVGSFAANIVPTTIFQRSLADGYGARYVSEDNPLHTRLATAALCGVIPATTATVVENCVTVQQELACAQKPSKPKQAFKEMWQHRGLLGPFRSYLLIAIRDGIFTSCVDVVCPETEKILNKTLSKHFPGNTKITTNLAHYSAYLGVGFLGAAFSHPFDTVATTLQKTMKTMSYKDAFFKVRSMPLDNNKRVWFEAQNFYRGFLYRFGLFSFFLAINQIRRDLVSPTVQSSFNNANKNAQSRLDAESSQKPKSFTPQFGLKNEKQISTKVAETGREFSKVKVAS